MKENQFETDAIRTQAERSQHREHSVPLYLTSSFTYDSAEQMRSVFADEEEGFIYSRFNNPNFSEFVDKMCKLEGAEAGYATATGMAAVYAGFAALLSAGDHIVSCRSIFGSTHTVLTKILPRFGITTTYVDVDDYEGWEKAIQPNTKMIFVETPSNPGLDVIDMEFVGKLAEKHGIIFHVDNCFATPYLQRPIDFGAHLVSHSGTKWLDGQGRVMGGILVGDKKLIDAVYTFCRSTGPAISPFNAWILSKSLETLAVRMDRHCDNALKLANCLEHHPELDNVRYPGLMSHPHYKVAQKQMKKGGGLITFEVKGGMERGKKFLDALLMCSLTANLGDSRTIVTHPASTTHAKLTEEERQAVSISAGLVRVSVGLENIADIISDIEQALAKSS
ncbi:MAG: O-succinylhomoserine sulfhydrylase [Flavobacteriales bacterium]|nr:O-succinylhomoserine sulfhydrylase [Flavobacteriales bacterium]